LAIFNSLIIATSLMAAVTGLPTWRDKRVAHLVSDSDHTFAERYTRANSTRYTQAQVSFAGDGIAPAIATLLAALRTMISAEASRRDWRRLGGLS
jgi:hypothetical protein